MLHKAFPITEFKVAQDGDDPGTFEAIVSVFGNVDRGGDQMQKGAFTRTLKERGMPPVVWSHNWDIPPIGVTTSAVETDEGLHIKGRLFVGEGEDHPVARQVYTAMKATGGDGLSPLREFSFGYEVVDSETKTVDGTDVRGLNDVELFEVGPTLVGMNPATRLVGVKTDDTQLAVKDQDEDKPEPKPTMGDEDREKIGRLLADKPQHLNPKE